MAVFIQSTVFLCNRNEVRPADITSACGVIWMDQVKGTIGFSAPGEDLNSLSIPKKDIDHFLIEKMVRGPSLPTSLYAVMQDGVLYEIFYGQAEDDPFSPVVNQIEELTGLRVHERERDSGY